MDLLSFSVRSLNNAAESEIRPSIVSAVSVDEWIDLIHGREVTLELGTYNFFFLYFLISAFLKYCYVLFKSKKE